MYCAPTLGTKFCQECAISYRFEDNLVFLFYSLLCDGRVQRNGSSGWRQSAVHGKKADPCVTVSV